MSGSPNHSAAGSDLESAAWSIVLHLSAGHRVLALGGGTARAANLGRGGAEVVSFTSGRLASDDRFDAIVAIGAEAPIEEVADHLRAGGTLLWSIANPLYQWGPLRAVIGWTVARSETGTRGVSLARARARLEGCGLEVSVWAPLPTATHPKFLVPLGERAVIDYFFSHLAPRPRGGAGRIALKLAKVAGRLGVLTSWLPAWELLGARRG